MKGSDAISRWAATGGKGGLQEGGKYTCEKLGVTWGRVGSLVRIGGNSQCGIVTAERAKAATSCRRLSARDDPPNTPAAPCLY